MVEPDVQTGVYFCLKGAVEIFEGGERKVPLRQYRCSAIPVETKAVVTYSCVVLLAVFRRYQVISHGIVAEGFKAMSKAFGYIIGEVIAGRQLCGIVLAIGAALFPEVDEHIEYATLGTKNHLGMVVRRQLKMHTPDHLLVGKREIAFLQLEINVCLLKKAVLKGFCEITPVIVEGGQGNNKSTGQRQRIKMEHCCNV